MDNDHDDDDDDDDMVSASGWYDYDNPNDAQNFVADAGDSTEFEGLTPSPMEAEAIRMGTATSLDLVQAPRKVEKVC